MTLRELLTRCVKLIGVALLLGVSHLPLYLEVAPRVAHELSPPFDPRSEAPLNAVLWPPAGLCRENSSANYIAWCVDNVVPRTEFIRTTLTLVYGAAYTILSLLILWSLGLWLRRQAIPSLVVKFNRVMQSIPVKNVLVNWRLKRAENEYRTLVNLHQNSLLSEEVFLRRKAALKSILEKT